MTSQTNSPVIPYIDGLKGHMDLRCIEMSPAEYIETLSDEELWDAVNPARQAWKDLTGQDTPVDHDECAKLRALVQSR